MITVTNLSKAYGDQELFKEFNLSINHGEKIGLIGPNGAGKTTFFLIILGKLEPSQGNIQINRNIRIGYLPQEASFKSDSSVLSEVVEGDEHIIQLKKEKEELEAKSDTTSERYGQILHDLEFLGFFELEYKAKKILMGLGFKEDDFVRPISHLSGGWQMRVLLAKLLTCHYDVLLLDEPMNHLDLTAALWFKDYLASFQGTFVMISHDKAFLNEVTNYTLVLEHGQFTKVKGTYDDYERIRRQKREHLLRQFKVQEKKRQQLKEFMQRFHAQPNKAAQVRAKERMLERMQEIIVPEDRQESIRDFHFPQSRRSGYRVMKLDKISKSYGDITVYKDFDFEVSQGEKAVLVGPNGAGKSTLLRIMAGVIDIDKGLRVVGHNVDVGYFSQRRMDILNPQNTVLEEASMAARGNLSTEEVRTILGAFLFSGQDVDKKVTVLSGGEKSRLNLAKFLVNPPNFLLLDEPTTHLDVDAVDALIKALTEYNGTLVFISHDIHFVRSVANAVFEVRDGKVRKFPGNLDYYLTKEDKSYGQEEKSLSKPGLGKKPQKENQEEVNHEALKKAQVLKRRVHNARIDKQVKSLEKKREKLEIEQYAKKRILSNPRSYLDEERRQKFKMRLKDLDKNIADINSKIAKFKSSFL